MRTNIGNYVTSLIRTVVPIVIGTVAAWAVKHGINIDQAKADAWLIPECIGGYYAAVRALEQKVPAAGWLLGKAVTPVYPTVAKP